MTYPHWSGMVPTTWMYFIQFEFWSPQMHQYLHLHSICHQNNKTYPLTPDLHCHEYIHVCVVYHLLDSCNLCTHIWQLVHLYYRCHMAILQHSALPSAVPTNHNLGFIHIYSHFAIRHFILPLIKPFNLQIIFSFSCHNQVIRIQQLPW